MFSFNRLKDPGYFAENRLPAHSDHHFYNSEYEMFEGTNSQILSLNGVWKFAYAPSECQVPAGFEAADFDCHSFGEIAVPAHMQMEGYGLPQYVNQQYPWDGWEEITIGEIPEKFNPVGCYVKYFRLPAAMKGKRTFISFQGVESCIAVWLNGKYVGFSSNSFSPCEFELTDALVEGENKLACRVYKWSAGSWMEDQDFFRFSGIYRDVFLYSVNEAHIQDLKVTALPNASYDQASFVIDGKLLGGISADIADKWSISAVLDGEVKVAAIVDGSDFHLEFTLENPLLWSAEVPNLYELTLRLYSLTSGSGSVANSSGNSDTDSSCSANDLNRSDISATGSNCPGNDLNRSDISATGSNCPGNDLNMSDISATGSSVTNSDIPVSSSNTLTAEDKLIEIVPLKVGVRRFEIKDKLMCINGKRIVFRGVNRHDFDARVGRAVTKEMIRRDLVTMKQNNINALRTSHYSNSAYVYELCDELGLYVIAENNLETHGSWNLIERGDKPIEFALPGDRLDWEPMLADRINSTYQTCKNHPGIVIWSLGNESFGGSVLGHMGDLFRSLDPNRLVHYEGVIHDRRYNDQSSDMESQMYPSVASIKEFLKEHRDKPFICCEYSHAMGNSCGGLSLYTDLTEEEPLYQGGFIWDYIDQAIYGKDRFGNVCYKYGGDCGDRPTDYAFSGNGIATADGKPSVKMHEVKFDYQPADIKVDCEKMTVTIYNRNLFLNTEEYEARVTVLRDGKEVEKKKLHLPVKAQETKTFELPIKPFVVPGEYAVTVAFCLADDTLWAKRGHEVAFGQGIMMVNEADQTSKAHSKTSSAANSASTGTLKIVHGWYNLGVIGDDFKVLFSYLDGGLASYQYGGKEMLSSIPLPNFWRPVVDNDLGGQVNLRCAQWKVGSEFISHRQIGKGYWNDAYSPVIEEQDGFVTVTYTYHMPTTPASSCTVSYQVSGDGSVTTTLHYEPVEGLPPMPEFGMMFKMDADYENLTWYGMGPGESYVDRSHGVRLGIWENKVADNLAKHLRPQESGSHLGVRWAKITDEKGRGLIFGCASTDEIRSNDGIRSNDKLPGDKHPDGKDASPACHDSDHMTFSAPPYTPHEIDCAAHAYELPRVNYTVLRPSLMQMGVGGDDTWGSIPHEQFWIDNKKELTFSFSFKGITRDNLPF